MSIITQRLEKWMPAVLASSVILTLILFGILAYRVDAKDNATRCAVVVLVERLAANSARNAKATLASNTASHAQKQAATQNLAAIEAVETTTKDALHHPSGAACT